MMQRTTLHLETVTPCFLGGAEQEKAEWRAASIRGQLRWWFRALVGGELEGELREVRRAEEEVFGSTGQRSRLTVHAAGPQSSWEKGQKCPWDQRQRAEDLAQLAGLKPGDEPGLLDRLRIMKRRSDGTKFEIPTDPLQYLGYGCIEWSREARGFVLGRSCFEPGQSFSLRLQWREKGPGSLPEEARRRLALALWAWLHLGGIGARSRNGYGSLAVSRIDGALPSTGDLSFTPGLEELRRGANAVLRCSRHEREAAWSHVSGKSRILISRQPYPSWDDALCAAGAWVLTFRRRYGSDSDGRSLDGLALANRDYVWAEEAFEGGTTPGGFPDKAGFGLPLMFDKQGAAVTWLPVGGGEGGREDRRRASPLLIHIAKVGSHTFHPVLTDLPAKLLPDDGELRFRRRVGRDFKLRSQPRQKAGSTHRTVVGLFLDRLKAQGVVQEVKA